MKAMLSIVGLATSFAKPSTALEKQQTSIFVSLHSWLVTWLETSSGSPLVVCLRLCCYYTEVRHPLACRACSDLAGDILRSAHTEAQCVLHSSAPAQQHFSGGLRRGLLQTGAPESAPSMQPKWHDFFELLALTLPSCLICTCTDQSHHLCKGCGSEVELASN